MTRSITICAAISMAAMILLPRQTIAQSEVGIGPGTPDPSAILDASSTTKGFLPPRLTEAQRDAIAPPADGLIISCTNCAVEGLQQYINGTWKALAFVISAADTMIWNAKLDTETDPIYTASEAANITSSDITHLSNLSGTNTGDQEFSISFNDDTLHLSNGNYVIIPGISEANHTYRPGTVHCNPANPTEIVAVMNPTTGETWMDRNLGASQVAASSTDTSAYGDLYQWGRGADGHQCRNSATTTTLSNTNQPGHGNFIIVPVLPRDWRIPQNGMLWQGVNGVNHPCPRGYRLPTEAELQAELTSWGILNNTAGAFASPLKLPVAGGRDFGSGSLFAAGSDGFCWSSMVSSADSRLLNFFSSNASMTPGFRAYGFSVRCLKE